MGDKITIDMTWDPEACVWIASCDDIGLVLESESFDTLIVRVRDAILDLLGITDTQGEVSKE